MSRLIHEYGRLGLERFGYLNELNRTEDDFTRYLLFIYFSFEIIYIYSILNFIVFLLCSCQQVSEESCNSRKVPQKTAQKIIKPYRSKDGCIIRDNVDYVGGM